MDWVKFNATWRKTYTIDTSDLGVDNDTVLELYDSTGSGCWQRTTIASTAYRLPASSSWVATSTGVFYIKVSHEDSEGGCAGYEYNLVVREVELY